MLIINRKEVERLLPMAACIDVMSDAMRAASAGAVAMPLRLFTPLADNSGSLGLMPGSTLEPPFFGAKVISLRFDNPAKGLPTVQGFVSLFEHGTGTPVALIEGSSVTAIRTAAASGLATRELARRDARTHVSTGWSCGAGIRKKYGALRHNSRSVQSSKSKRRTTRPRRRPVTW
jgi:ornithine cyclodeaminase